MRPYDRTKHHQEQPKSKRRLRCAIIRCGTSYAITRPQVFERQSYVEPVVLDRKTKGHAKFELSCKKLSPNSRIQSFPFGAYFLLRRIVLIQNVSPNSLLSRSRRVRGRSLLTSRSRVYNQLPFLGESRLHAPKQAVLFDLDGTLIDTTDLILQCFQHSWTAVCGVGHSREDLLQTFGTPLRSAMWQLLGKNKFRPPSGNGHSDAEIVEHLLTEYRSFNLANHDRLTRSFKDVRRVLIELRMRGYSIGVVSSKSRELGLRGLRLFSLHDLVDSSVFLEDTDSHKPHAAPVLAALRRLDAEASLAAYVGDSPHDIISARGAGVRSVAALWGPATRAELESERPDYLAESFSDLLEIFR